MEWHDIETAPRDMLILLGTESDPAVDRHMFFISLGWSYEDGFWSVARNDIIFPSHWASITSPIAGAAVTFHRNGQYVVNELA